MGLQGRRRRLRRHMRVGVPEGGGNAGAVAQDWGTLVHMLMRAPEQPCKDIAEANVRVGLLCACILQCMLPS